METTDRFPPGLGNLAENARFPHSHSPLHSFFGEENDKNTAEGPLQNPVSVAMPWWPVLRCRSMAGFEVSTEDAMIIVSR
jgi:hypothetical protein